MVTHNLWTRSKRLAKQLLGRDLFIDIQVNTPVEFHGSSYGGWYVAANSLNTNSVVYSFGIGQDVTFDLSLIERYSVAVYGFDPTPTATRWVQEQRLPDLFEFFPYGIGATDGTITFYPPVDPTHASYSAVHRSDEGALPVHANVYRLFSIMQKLGHDHIDLLKMDIEGMEYEVLKDIVQSRIRIRQILVEFHHRFKEIKVEQTKQAVQLLNQHGYRIFKISPSGEEYSFLLQ